MFHNAEKNITQFNCQGSVITDLKSPFTEMRRHPGLVNTTSPLYYGIHCIKYQQNP